MEKAEIPVLRLGLLGFNPAQQALFETALVMLRTRMKWTVVPFGEADAVWVNGSRALQRADGQLQVADSRPGAPPICILPADSDRPLAFSLPLGPGITAESTFDMASPASTRSMLEKFENWLRPLCIQFCLASRIVEERLEVNSTVFHVSVDGRLVAIVSRRTGVGALPIADPFRLKDAIWSRRPDPADELPGHFVQAGLSQVLWQYAMRTDRNLLPPHFRSGTIYWCRLPQLPHRMLGDSHLVLVRELTHASASLAELGKRTGLAEPVLVRDLAALRLVGAVTNDRKQALRAAFQPPGRDAGSPQGRKPHPIGMAAWRADRSGTGSPLMDRTAPAPLLPQEG